MCISILSSKAIDDPSNTLGHLLIRSDMRTKDFWGQHNSLYWIDVMIRTLEDNIYQYIVDYHICIIFGIDDIIQTFHFLLAISSPLYHVLFHWFVYDDYTMTSVYLIPDDILFRVETKLIILLGLKTVIFTFESLYYICIYIWNWRHHSFPVWSTMLRISSSGSPGPYRGSSDPK